MVGERSPERSPLDAALAYVARGWRVIPLHTVRANGACSCRYGTTCRTPGKHPRVDAWKDAASKNAAVVGVWWNDWPDANVGIVAGAASGLVVLDVDPDKGGADSLVELQRRYGTLPDTITAFTGGGGHHYFLAHPGSPHVLRNPTALAGLRGLDVRADGGYVVGAPSGHLSGRRYCWQHYEDRELAPAPGWLVDLLTQPEPLTVPPSANGHLNGHHADDDGRKWLADALGRAHDGNSEPTGYWLAQQLLANRVNNHYALLQEYAAKASFRPGDPFTERDVQKWIRSARESDLVKRGDPARSRTAPATQATQAAHVIPFLPPSRPKREAAAPAASDVQHAARAIEDTPPERDTVSSMLDTVRESGSAQVIWDHLGDLAQLDQAQWGQTRAALKEALGKDLNLNDLERALREARKQARRAAREQRVSDEGLPVIEVTDRPLRDITTDAVKALHDANEPPTVYVRSGALSRVRAREDGRPVIDLMTEPIVRGRLARVASFVRASESGPSHISPPEDVVRDVLALGEWSFPPLVGITESPVLRPDGSIVSQPGYDASTRLIYAPPDDFELPPIPTHPSAEEVRAALSFVEEVIHDFPFVDTASHANAIALLLSPIVRPALGESNTPLALLDAPKAGTGKGLLAQAVATIATGRQNAIITAPGDEDEWRKRITAVLSMGATIINIDNLEGRFASANVAAALTTAAWQDRVLGRSETITLAQRATWLATGNNIRLGGDIPRRCYWIRMDAKMARPYERGRDQFKHAELLVWIAAHRGELLAALLTVARGWYAAKCPPAPDTLAIGSFEQWSHVLSGILAYAGVSDFLGNLATMHDQVDDDTPEWEHFLITWHETYAARIFTVAELVREFETPHAALRDALPGYLAAAYNKPGGSFTRALGKALAAQTDVRYGSAGLHLVRAGEFRRAVRWRVLDDHATASESASLDSVSESVEQQEFGV